MSDHNGSATLQLPAADGTKRSIPCVMKGLQGKRLVVHISEQIPESTLLSVEYEDTLFLGEVVVCAESEQEWKLEIRVEQMLNGLQSLMALRAHLLSESLTSPLPLLPVGMRN